MFLRRTVLGHVLGAEIINFRTNVEMEYLRRDFSKHEELDDVRFKSITTKLDKLNRFQLLVTGGGIVALAILQIFLKFYT